MRVFTLLLALLVAAVIDIQGQDQVPTAEAQRARLKICRTYADCTYYVGTVTAISADGIHLETDSDGSERPFARLTIRKLELSGGPGRSIKEGAFVGALMGGLVLGLISGAVTECEPGEWEDLCRTGQASAFVSGAFLGAGLGILIGSAIPKEKWYEVTLDQLGVIRAVVALDGRFGLARSIQF